jgi:plastocyanin domain-containing protein
MHWLSLEQYRQYLTFSIIIFMKTTVAIIIAGVIIGGAIMLTRNSGTSSTAQETGSVENVSVVDGKQIIEIKAKGGYTPRVSVAKANIPTILRFDTNGTFDCSSSVRIPSMNISQILPNSGSTDIVLGSPVLGTLQGTCGMGMYPFEVQFQG